MLQSIRKLHGTLDIPARRQGTAVSSSSSSPSSFAAAHCRYPAATRPTESKRIGLSPVVSIPSREEMKKQRRGVETPRVSSLPTQDDKAGPTLLTIPTMLTLARVVAIPALVICWCSQMWLWCWWLFIGASVTDFFDGYLARAWNCSTPFGAFLDPVADKLMVATVLILIGTVPIPAGYFAGNTWILPVTACIIIAREITMSALREWGATLGPEAHSAVAVSALGKYKTSSQMASLVLLLGAKTALPSPWEALATDTGLALLGIAAFLTVSSLLSYFRGLWKFMV